MGAFLWIALFAPWRWRAMVLFLIYSLRDGSERGRVWCRPTACIAQHGLKFARIQHNVLNLQHIAEWIC